MKTEPIIFPLHVIYLTEDGKEMEGKDGESWKNHSLPTDLSFTRCSSILGAPLNLVLLDNRDLQPLETNDAAEEGQQLTASSATLVLRRRDGRNTSPISVCEAGRLLFKFTKSCSLIHRNEKLRGYCSWKNREKTEKQLKRLAAWPLINELVLKFNTVVKYQWSVNTNGPSCEMTPGSQRSDSIGALSATHIE